MSELEARLTAGGGRVGCVLALLTAALLSCSWPEETAAAPIPVERHGSSYEVRFAADQLVLEETGHGIEASLGQIPDAPREPGAPSLPLVPVVVEIPHDRTAASIEVDVEETVVARSVAMAAAPVPGQGDEPPQMAPKRPDLFAGVYPPEIAQLAREDFARGHRLLTVLLAPLRWDPASGELRLATTIRFRLGLEAATDRPLERFRTIPAADFRYERALAAAVGAARPQAAPASRFQAPDAPFVPTFRPSTDGSPVEYLILTSDQMAAEFQLLADWRTQTGLQATVRTIEWVETTYPNGADRAEQLRFFLRDAYQNWGTLWVLLGGDTEIIPTRFAVSTVQTAPGNPAFIPCDLYFACLDNNWNGDGDDRIGEGRTANDPGDSADLMPELYVGRAPVSSSQEAAVFVEKLIGYERTPPVDPAYPASILFLAEDLGFTDGALIAEQAVAQVHPWMKKVRLYENFGNFPGSLPLSRQAALDSTSSGFGWVHHVGHGFRNTMSVGDDAINNADADALTNGDRQSFVFAINCSSASIDFNSIGEHWIKNPNGGAVGYVGTSRLAYPTVSERYQNEFYRLAFADSIATAGECLFMCRLPWVANSFDENFDRWTQLALLLLGDPVLPLWTDTPTPLSGLHPGDLTLGTGSFTVTAENQGLDPVPDARVTLWMDSEDYRSGLTDQAGQITLPFNPDTTGTFLTTITGRNYLPYEAQVPVLPATTSFLIFDHLEVKADGTGGTSGNGDGLIDAGETAELRLHVRNQGSSTATSVEVDLVAESGAEHLELLTLPQVYGNIDPGQVASGTFLVHLLSSAPHGFQPVFRLDATAVEGSWSDIFVLPVYTVAIAERGHFWSDPPPTGNDNGIIEPGEAITYTVELRNDGQGEAEDVEATLRVLNSTSGQPDPLVTVTDSTHTYGDMPPRLAGAGDFAFSLDLAANPAQLLLELSVAYRWGDLALHLVDLTPPSAVDSLRAFGSEVAITLKWAPSESPDVLGYDIFRAASPGGPFTRINDQTVIGISLFEDFPLPPLTRHYYKIAARDSSLNEGEASGIILGSTTPPMKEGWPIEVVQSTTSSPKVADFIPGDDLEFVLGANCIYAWHASGQEVRDGDGDPRTSGVFTIEGCDPLNGFRSDAAIADLNEDGELEIIIAGWGGSGAGALHVLEPDGTPRDGWPRTLHRSFNWASAAVGQVVGDSNLDLVAVQGEGAIVYAFHSDGTEIRDGDSNPATIGPFFQMASGFTYGSPALGDLDNDTLDEIVVVQNAAPGLVYAIDGDGSVLPGWPFQTGEQITSSPAIFDLDGNGSPEVIVTSEVDSVFVLESDGTVYPGWPRFAVVNTLTGRTPSPVVADIDRNGVLDILVIANDGQIHIWDRDGNVLPDWQDVFFAQEAVELGTSEATPTVGDIDGDGEYEILVGAEDGRLYGFNHDATEVLGFPIQLEGEVRSSATIWDIDGDGLVEIALSGWDQNIYVWDMEGTFNPALIPWPFFRHDLMNRGNPDAPHQIGVGDPGRVLPLVYRLGRARPNPFNPTTTIDFDVPMGGNAAPVRLRIYDVAGRLVRTLVDGPMETGRHTLVWDGRDEESAALPTGIYLLKAEAPGFDTTRKLTLLK